jgi:hypothetical protein
MQVTFKKQVQEWKDLLLRGSDPAALRHYEAAFQQEEQNVVSAAAQLKETRRTKRSYRS